MKSIFVTFCDKTMKIDVDLEKDVRRQILASLNLGIKTDFILVDIAGKNCDLKSLKTNQIYKVEISKPKFEFS